MIHGRLLSHESVSGDGVFLRERGVRGGRGGGCGCRCCGGCGGSGRRSVRGYNSHRCNAFRRRTTHAATEVERACEATGLRTAAEEQWGRRGPRRGSRGVGCRRINSKERSRSGERGGRRRRGTTSSVACCAPCNSRGRPPCIRSHGCSLYLPEHNAESDDIIGCIWFVFSFCIGICSFIPQTCFFRMPAAHQSRFLFLAAFGAGSFCQLILFCEAALSLVRRGDGRGHSLASLCPSALRARLRRRILPADSSQVTVGSLLPRTRPPCSDLCLRRARFPPPWFCLLLPTHAKPQWSAL